MSFTRSMEDAYRPDSAKASLRHGRSGAPSPSLQGGNGSTSLNASGVVPSNATAAEPGKPEKHGTLSPPPAPMQSQKEGEKQLSACVSEADGPDDLVSLAELLTKQKSELRSTQHREEARRIAKMRQEQAIEKGRHLSSDRYAWKRPSSYGCVFQKTGLLPVKYLGPNEQEAAVRPSRAYERKPDPVKGPFIDVSTYPQLFPEPRKFEAINAARAAVLGKTNKVSKLLRFHGQDSAYENVYGVYKLLPYQLVNGQPIWRKDPPHPMVIYTNKSGKWQVGSPEQVEEERKLLGTQPRLSRWYGASVDVVTDKPHQGRYPQLMKWGVVRDGDFQPLDYFGCIVEKGVQAPPISRATGGDLGHNIFKEAPEIVKKAWLPTYGTPRELGALNFVDERLW